MRIPKKIKINGHLFKIKTPKNREWEDGKSEPATSWARNNTIWIDKLQSLSRQESCLLHEIIEMINYDYQLSLEHKTISQLEAGIYQVLKDNNLIIK